MTNIGYFKHQSQNKHSDCVCVCVYRMCSVCQVQFDIFFPILTNLILLSAYETHAVSAVLNEEVEA